MDRLVGLAQMFLLPRTQITDSTEDLMSVVDSTEWEGASTNTAAALGTALEVLGLGSKEGVRVFRCFML